jgi:hypothetical protein
MGSTEKRSRRRARAIGMTWSSMLHSIVRQQPCHGILEFRLHMRGSVWSVGGPSREP